MKKALTSQRRKHCALRLRPKIFAPPQTPSRGHGTAKI